MRTPVFIAAVLVALAWARPAKAQVACSVSGTPIAFGTYDVLSAVPLDTVGQVSWTCIPGENPSPEIFLSTGSSGTYAARTMRQGIQVLQYNIYLDAARTVIWGDGTGGTSWFISGTSTDTGTVNMYARCFAGQDVPPGTYADTIIVTMLF